MTKFKRQIFSNKIYLTDARKCTAEFSLFLQGIWLFILTKYSSSRDFSGTLENICCLPLFCFLCLRIRGLNQFKLKTDWFQLWKMPITFCYLKVSCDFYVFIILSSNVVYIFIIEIVKEVNKINPFLKKHISKYKVQRRVHSM